MRLVGYCTGCRRFKYVRVNGHSLALSQARGGVVEGSCTDCDRKDEEARKLRQQGGRR